MKPKQEQNNAIQLMMKKIEFLTQEVQKLNLINNDLIDNKKLQEIQFKNLQKKFDCVWNQLNDEQKIKFNFDQDIMNPKHVEFYGSGKKLEKPETKSSDTKHNRLNSQPIILPVVHQCLECKNKEQIIEQLNDTLIKYEIQMKKPKTSFSTRLNTEFSSKDIQNQYQQFTTKSNFIKFDQVQTII